MADAVGLNADLELDIARALSQVDQLESALNAATTGLPVDLDFLSSVSSFSDAMAAAVADISTTPVDVLVEADTSGAEQMILDLGNAPPVDVPVDADVTQATSSIDALETTVPPIDIPVEADTADASAQIADLGAESVSASEGVAGLEGSVTGLGAAAGIAEGSARELVTAVGEIGGESGKAAAGGVLALTAATGGFFEAGLTAVSAGQRFDLVLGDMGNKIKEIDVNGLNVSMEDLGISFGSTSAEMENVNSKLYQNAINAGVSKDKAVEFTKQIETLSARAISLNPQLGTLGDVASTLGDKIARGGKFASNYGIQLTAAEIATRALADTGKTAAADLTIVEKSIAGAELASEKYGDTLATTVAEGQKNAAVQAESLKASFKEAIEQIGVPLVSPVLDLIREAEPDAVLIAETLGHLAADILPLVSEALAILGPPLQLVAAILDAIPGPLVQGAAAWYLAAAAIGALGAAVGVLELEIPPLAIAVGVIAAAVGIYNSVFGDAAPYTDDVTKSVDAAAKGFEDLTASVSDTTTAEVDAALQTKSFREALDRTNISRDQLAASLAEGGDAFTTYANQILYAAEAEGVGFDGAIKLREELVHLRDATEQESLKALQLAVDQGLITKEQRNAAIAATGTTDATRSATAALDDLTPAIDSAKKAIEDKKKADEDAKAAAEAHAKAMDLLAASAPAVAIHLVDVQTTTEDVTAALGGLGVALGDANLSTDQFNAVAQELGVTTDQLKGFISDVTKEVNGFVDTAMKGLPNVASAIDDVLNPKKEKPKAIIIDPDQLQAEIDADIAKIDAFNVQLAFLTQHGLDNLAKEAAQRGPEFTGALVTSIQNGGDDVGTALDEKFGELNQKTRDEGPLLSNAGLSIVTATGDIGRDASKNFGDTFDIQAPTQAQLDAAKTIAIQEQIPFKDALRQVAGDAAVAYQERLSGVTGSTSDTMEGISTSVEAGKPTVFGAWGSAGAGATSAFGQAIGGVSGEANSAIASAGAVIIVASTALRAIAYSQGYLVGHALDEGIAAGIDGDVAAITSSARDAVQAGINAARAQAGVRSPSRVMEELGRQMIAGLAGGLADVSTIEAASADLASAAVPSLAPVSVAVGSVGSPSMTPVGAGGPLIGSLTVVVDGTGKSKSDLRRDGYTVASAVLDRMTPAAGQRLSTAVKVL